MRRVPIYFLCVEILDIITTIIGLRMGMEEINPMSTKFGLEVLFTYKIIMTLVVTVALQLKRKQKADIIVPLVAVVPIIFNCINLILAW